MSLNRVADDPSRPTGRKTNKPEPLFPRLNGQLVAQWSTTLQSISKQHKSEGKILEVTDVSMERFQNMAELFLHLVGKNGQKHYQQCLWAKRQLDALSDSVLRISDTLEVSGSKEDCLDALRDFFATSQLSPPTEDIQGRIGASASNESCNQAIRASQKNQMAQAEAKRHEFLANMWFAEQYESHSEKLKNRSPPSPELEELKQYSEARGRSTGQGRTYQTLFVDYLVDHSDPNSGSLTLEVLKKARVKMGNIRRDGLWFSKLYRQFGPGIFCYITVQTKTA
jgi:hypothetical protein